ncbi:hypothetical protein BU23DRAFT_553599 [Bimuria novae-zelandiae CBS 107.79]|uniref:Uncharacterized protein n=1 Tax=Bimuria novae-zelandiae CBS 107.79 TaxID=1447943 RepID=A0A6A5VE37_9PLEO|nr:hypothetical protein BU23DRAFT_553599 [Bimuria novae-zelandiae CBS 107.79]
MCMRFCCTKESPFTFEVSPPDAMKLWHQAAKFEKPWWGSYITRRPVKIYKRTPRAKVNTRGLFRQD